MYQQQHYSLFQKQLYESESRPWQRKAYELRVVIETHEIQQNRVTAADEMRIPHPTHNYTDIKPSSIVYSTEPCHIVGSICNAKP